MKRILMNIILMIGQEEFICQCESWHFDKWQCFDQEEKGQRKLEVERLSRIAFAVAQNIVSGY